MFVYYTDVDEDSQWVEASPQVTGFTYDEVNDTWETGSNLSVDGTASFNGGNVSITSSSTLLFGTTTTINANDVATFSKPSGSAIFSLTSGSLVDNEGAYFSAASPDGLQVAQVGVLVKNGASPTGFLRLDMESGAGQFLWVDNNGILKISTGSGFIGTLNGNVVGAQTSDSRVKNILGPLEYGLDAIKKIEPVCYSYKTDPNTKKLGFIAQQVLPIVPESVYDTAEPVAGEPEGSPTKLGMEYVELIPVLVNAVKELSTHIETLKDQNASLEARLNTLEEGLN